jgi:hypothetical protein
MILGFSALGFLVMLLLGRMFTVMELRSLERDYRQNQSRFSDLEEDLETSRRKYLIALKSEGVGKHKVSQLRTRCASLKQHLEQLEITAAQQESKKAENLQGKLEGLVMKALGGATVRRDSQFKRVMKVINQLVDLENKENGEELVAAIQKKIAGLGREGLLRVADRGVVAKPEEANAETKPESGEGKPEPEQMESGQASAEEEHATGRRDKVSEALHDHTAPQPVSPARQTESQARKDLVRDAIVKKNR